MKIETLKSLFGTYNVRKAVASLFFVGLCLSSFEGGSAQLKNPRRVTAVQLGSAAEGSRVTVASDTPLNDYEGFRRGDRFYVKIPLADFVSAMPRFRGDGFDDVQVQKVGDSVVISFKLQPGARARIDQRGNHLDVIFSVAKQAFNAPLVANTNSNSPGNLSPYTNSSSADNEIAGPTPPTSAATRGRFVESFDQSSFSRSSRSPRFGKRPGSEGNSAGLNQTLSSASPLPSPSATFSPIASSGYPPLTTATPANLNNSSSTSTRTDSSSSSGRKAAIMRWISANRLATLLGALILLSLLAYLISGWRKRQAVVAKTRESKSAKVQPKYSENESLEELTPKRTEPLSQRETVASSPEAPVTRAEAERPWALTRPTIVSPGGAAEEISDKEDREVFEL